MHLDMNTATELVDIAVRAVVALAPVVAIMWPVVVKAAPTIISSVVANLPDKRMAQATAVVSHAGLIASGQTVAAVYEALAKAKDPKSPGGAAITPDEWAAIIGTGKSLAWKALLDQGAPAVENVLNVYGGGAAGQEAAKAGLAAIVVGDALKALQRAGVDAPSSATAAANGSPGAK